jgi:hypothetical protein
MLAKEIEFVDYNGHKRKETHYFDLSKAELLEMDICTVGGLQQYVNKIISTENGPELFKLFKTLILKAYGIKEADGVHFTKSEEISTRFSQTPAYSVLMMELVTSAENTEAFLRGVAPTDVFEEASVDGNKVVPIEEKK